MKKKDIKVLSRRELSTIKGGEATVNTATTTLVEDIDKKDVKNPGGN